MDRSSKSAAVGWIRLVLGLTVIPLMAYLTIVDGLRRHIVPWVVLGSALAVLAIIYLVGLILLAVARVTGRQAKFLGLEAFPSPSSRISDAEIESHSEQ